MTGNLASNRRRVRSGKVLPLETLEGRLLMSGVPQVTQQIAYGQANYLVSVTGPGSVSLSNAGKGLKTINLSGTTSASTVSIVQTSTSQKYNGSLLSVGGINVRSGQIGQILGAGAVDLLGTLTTAGAVQSIQLGGVGPAAKILANGGLGSLGVSGGIDLGLHGKIHVTGDLSGGLVAGSIALSGGQILIDHNLASLTAGSISLTSNGLLSVGNNAGPIQVNGDVYLAKGGALRVVGDSSGLTSSRNLTLDPGGQISIGRDETGAVSVSGSITINAGQIIVGRDLTGSITVNGGFGVTSGGNLTVGRDFLGGLNVNGNLGLGSGGYFNFGRSVGSSGSSTGITVGGNLFTGGGGLILVGGNLGALNVNGVIVGQGNGAVDLSVGLDLDNWSVQGGLPNAGGVNGFNLAVTKNLVGINITHGLFNSFVTAGVAISNLAVGADGPIAVFDSQIRAGVQITNTTFAGDVESDRPTNPVGGLTRIVAGEDRSGTFEIGGNMVNVIVTGSLINAVLAASVEPYGGNGSSSVTPVATPIDGSQGTYNAPLGGVYRAYANTGLPYAAPPFDTKTDPIVVDRVLPGSINRPFAPASPTDTSGAVLLPSQSTVDGGVITTAHANGSDYAGIYAADTSGVFVGSLPG